MSVIYSHRIDGNKKPIRGEWAWCSEDIDMKNQIERGNFNMKNQENQGEKMSNFIPNSFQIPNAFVDEMLDKVSGNACKVYLLIVRKTRGWNKEKDRISYSQIQKISGIKSHETIKNILDELVKIGLVIVKQGNEKLSNQYSLNDSFGTTEIVEPTSKGTTKTVEATTEIVEQGTTEIVDTENNSFKTTIVKTSGKTKSKKSESNSIDCPEDLKPNDKQIKKCLEYNIDANWLFEQFRDWHGSKGNKFVNWSLAFNTWINKHIQMNKLYPVVATPAVVSQAQPNFTAPVLQTPPSEEDSKAIDEMMARIRMELM